MRCRQEHVLLALSFWLPDQHGNERPVRSSFVTGNGH